MSFKDPPTKKLADALIPRPEAQRLPDRHGAARVHLRGLPCETLGNLYDHAVRKPRKKSKPKLRQRRESRSYTGSDRGVAMNVAAIQRAQEGLRKGRYTPPSDVRKRELRDLIAWSGRKPLADAQLTLFAGRRDDPNVDVFLAGDAELLCSPSVSVVGTREVTDEGWQRARRLGCELAAAGVVVVSGLAKGVDTAALSGAIDAGGHVVAVIGTPLTKAYPAENAELQQTIYRDHLLVSPFPVGEQVYPANFPKRNRVMAALSDATVIVEASDTSGTLHQADACQKLGRWLFILRSVVENPKVTWPRRFLSGPKTAIIDKTSEVLAKIGRP